MVAAQEQAPEFWRLKHADWVLLTAAVGLVGLLAFDGLRGLISHWQSREEYSHGFLIPAISLFLLWQNRLDLARQKFKGAWTGVVLCFIGIALFFLGALSTLNVIVQYAVLLILAGLALAFVGWQGMRFVWIPLIFLIFMIPLPPFLYNNLSQKLQLVSSELGVAVVRLFGISVFLEGNVIDLGTYKLQVVEACNGLRYLFPLMSFGFLCAYLFSAPFWQRAILFLSTIPITVLMNSFRIGVIGVLVERWGTEQAEGFLHDFEGWVIFMACVGVLFLEMWLLTLLRKDKPKFFEVFGFVVPPRTPKDAPSAYRKTSPPFIAATAVLALSAAGTVFLNERSEIIPARSDFADFPTTVGQWKGDRESLEPDILNALKLTDYVITDFRDAADDWVNFYVAYYASQRAGESIHSPRSCIPGGGWEIQGLSQRKFDDIVVAGQPLAVNRVEIQKGDYKQLVYYWFQQRGRVITNEYLVKWYLFLDSLTKNRSDGALVRLTTLVKPGEDLAKGDARLVAFAKAVLPGMEKYIPN